MAAPSTFADLAAEARKQTLSSVEGAYDVSLRAAELAAGLVPEDAFDPTRAVATAREAVEGGFDFAQQLLKQQRAYALRTLDVLGAGVSKPAK